MELVLAAVLGVLGLAAGYRAGRASTRQAALHDVLTGLPNRALFVDRVERALVTARRDATRPVVMLLDLDRFKEVNDALGHHHGDELLRQIGPRIAGVLRSSDTVARLGGDEFAVLLPTAVAPSAGLDVGEKIMEALQEPFHVEGVELEIGASLGIAAFPDHGEDVETLLQHADVAMYTAKGGRGGTPEVYARGTEARHDPLELVGQLRRAMEENELAVVYQPKVRLRTGEVEGVEALVRWRHPDRGLVLPSSFVGHAEHTGLIRPLTMYVLDEALAQVAAWRDGGLDLRVAVNISARGLLDRDLALDVGRLLRERRVPPAALELEITEATLMSDPGRAGEVLEALDDLGVGLSVDDFGTGFSSLSSLHRLPVGEVKIDRSLLGDATIVRSTIDLARNLGLRVVAEGIEEDQVRRRLDALGCDLGQGYLFSPPLDGDALWAWADARTLAAAA
jgi:diguanylate cyclase (GGDEF)-like protein